MQSKHIKLNANISQGDEITCDDLLTLRDVFGEDAKEIEVDFATGEHGKTLVECEGEEDVTICIKGIEEHIKSGEKKELELNRKRAFLKMVCT